MRKKKVLMVVTNIDSMKGVHATGLWLEEFAVPYIEFTNAGYEITVASPLGGKSPLDPNSLVEEIPAAWQSLKEILETTENLSDAVKDEYQALIIPGGHGPMFDLATDDLLASTLQDFMEKNKLIAAVCHGPAALVRAALADGTSILAGKKVTGFSNEEEVAVQLDKLVPFLLEDQLKKLGASYSKKDMWQEYVVVDGNLITGQNPQSSTLFAKTIIKELNA
ncbi:type 1 glutamine amidotransferase domain-containing protein [Propionispira raffinosivorans]|uniref:type 1 glutamine amidotransferase domain-containing protein n=1 Tax=Propionispira raffinosivorans TaxID=86959 RepID=UPI000368B4FA|nr:type 1 glutamine amidotransferase domain-containing protein [Propionispira raffinosivorans]